MSSECNICKMVMCCIPVVFGGNRCIPDDEREMYVEVEDNIAAVA